MYIDFAVRHESSVDKNTQISTLIMLQLSLAVMQGYRLKGDEECNTKVLFD